MFVVKNLDTDEIVSIDTVDSSLNALSIGESKTVGDYGDEKHALSKSDDDIYFDSKVASKILVFLHKIPLPYF